MLKLRILEGTRCRSGWNRLIWSYAPRKHLRTKVTPDFHLTVKMGEIWGRNQNDKNDNFHYFSIKSYVVKVY